jgi:hypothetical protein
MTKNHQASNGYRGVNRVSESRRNPLERASLGSRKREPISSSSSAGFRKIVSSYPFVALLAAVVLGGIAGWYAKRR